MSHEQTASSLTLFRDKVVPALDGLSMETPPDPATSG
jgi:hypothetical protein